MRPLLTSLSLRIFLICFIFLLIPFFVHALLHDENSRLALKHLLAFLFFLIVIGGSTTFFLVRRMAKPLRQLDIVMGEIERGDFSARYVPDKMGFEINILGSHFNRTIEALIQLKMGEQIQKSLFPKEMPHVSGLDIKAKVAFAKELGGDFYDVLKIEKDLLLTIADASGKGVGACLHSLGVRSLLRAAASSQKTQKNLKEALALTNSLFCEDTANSGYFVTAWVGRYDSETRLLEYSSCGHPHALLIRGKELIELSTPGIALGVEAKSPISTATVTLKPNDFILLYTDGLIEAKTADGKMFGKQRLINEILTHKQGDLIDHLLAVTASPTEPLFDDITLLSISVLLP